MRTRKLPIVIPIGKPRRLLQWGRVVEDAETLPTYRVDTIHPELQWGRVVEDAETALVNVGPLLEFPLQWGRVVEDAETLGIIGEYDFLSHCFNGAASLRTRKLPAGLGQSPSA